MKLENQVCSFEYAKKLKELGFEQDSIWYWVIDKAQNSFLHYKGEVEIWEGELSEICLAPGKVLILGGLKLIKYSAFTSAELGEKLPFRNKRMGTVNNAELIFTKLANAEGESLWNVAYYDEDFEGHLYEGMLNRIENKKNEANSRAEMLIYLKENNLI